MINYKAAKKILIKSNIKIKNETINSLKSLNRVCAKDVYSPVNYPAGNNTAFDGYAINSKDTAGLNKKNLKKFKILKTIAAGDNPKIKNIFELIEIMTLILSQNIKLDLHQAWASPSLNFQKIF